MPAFINSLFIPKIDIGVTADSIIDAFYCQNIATISRVTLVPYKNCLRAYLDIHEWHQSEAAHNFVQRLNDKKRETRFVHNDDNWCVVQVNRKPFVTKSRKMAKFTTINYLVTPITGPLIVSWILTGHVQW